MTFIIIFHYSCLLSFIYFNIFVCLFAYQLVHKIMMGVSNTSGGACVNQATEKKQICDMMAFFIKTQCKNCFTIHIF